MLRRGVPRMYQNTFGAGMIPTIANEPMKSFAPGSPDRAGLEAAVKDLLSKAGEGLEVPNIIGGKEYRTGRAALREIPSDNKKTLHKYWLADKETIGKAVQTSLDEGKRWARMPFQDRAAILLKAAQLISTSRRYEFQAATMMGQSKNPWQAEIDSVAETIDFYRFNVKYASEIVAQQPLSPVGTPWNMSEYRPLEGFCLAISPFNFTAIGANLATGPMLMGNTVVWKPSDKSMYSAYLTYQVLVEAGMPPGVINMVCSDPLDMNDVALKHPSMAACAFTGSTAVFKSLWKEVGNNMDAYKSYPRLTGETGGKNFHLVHPSAHVPSVVAQTVRSAFEYQGQKCSACSRLFCPKSLWPEVRDKMVEAQSKIKVGGPEDFQNFVCAVIDEHAFKKHEQYLKFAHEDSSCKVLAGGTASSEKGWFVQPTIVETSDINCKLLTEEIFGPVLTCYVYDDSKPNSWTDICNHLESAVQYGLTGAIWSNDRWAINEAADILQNAAGNLYINDKSTGAVVGQQPFGGGRVSGTNDKPGAPQFLMRFVSPRSIKESLEHLPNVSYPHQLPDVVTVE